MSYVTGYKQSAVHKTMDYLLFLSRYWKSKIGKATYSINAASIGGTRRVKCYFTGRRTRVEPKYASEEILRYEIANFSPGANTILVVKFPRKDYGGW